MKNVYEIKGGGAIYWVMADSPSAIDQVMERIDPDLGWDEDGETTVRQMDLSEDLTKRYDDYEVTKTVIEWIEEYEAKEKDFVLCTEWY